MRINLLKKVDLKKYGKKSNWGGKRPGSGRPPDWFRKLCEKEIIGKKELGIRKVGSIARGEAKIEKIFQHEGKIIRAETGVAPSDIIQANSFLSDRAFGKATQNTDITSNGKSLLEVLGELNAES